MKLLSIFALIILVSCQGTELKKEPQEKEAVSTLTSSNSFLDSVSKKYDLSVAQIRKNTSIDTMWYSENYPSATFKGDTILDLAHGLKGIVIDYTDGRKCSCKFLAIFNPDGSQTGDHRFIHTDCDRDKTVDFRVRRFKQLSDSSFETEETYLPRNTEKKIMKTLKWKIDESGRIDSLR